MQAVRDRVETFAQRLALESHYRRHPTSRPTLGDLAVAAAELDDSPLAATPDLLRLASEEVVILKPDADADDVAVDAAALSRHSSRAAP